MYQKPIVYQKKPIKVEAFQMTLERRWDNQDWPPWLHFAWNTRPGKGSLFIDSYDLKRERLLIGTRDWVRQVDWDDWIIQDVDGELQLCKPDIFESTYELLDQ